MTATMAAAHLGNRPLSSVISLGASTKNRNGSAQSAKNNTDPILCRKVIMVYGCSAPNTPDTPPAAHVPSLHP